MDESHKQRASFRPKLYLWLVAFLVAFPVYAVAPERPQTPKIAVLNHNTLRPITTTTYKENITLGAISTEDLFSGLKFSTIIKCLAKYESGYNINAKGAAGERGILQYMSQTFEMFCEGDWENPLDQVICADKMLTENWNNINHWTTRHACLTTN